MIPYIIKNFRGGISDENDKGIAGSFKHGYSLNLHKRNDSLSCGSTMVTVLGESVGVFGDSSAGTTMTGVVNVFVPASDGSLYAFTDQGSIWCMTGDGQWVFVYNDPAGKITGAAEFKDTNGDNYLYWATSSQISRKAFPGSNIAPDTGTARWTDAVNEYKVEFISSAATWHTMKRATGALMIANGESLAGYDFDTTWDPILMSVTPGDYITALEEKDDYVIMGSQRIDESEEGSIWSWITTADNYLQKKKVPAKGVNALIRTELPLAQVGSDGKLFFTDFSNVVPVNTITGGGKANPSGVDIYDSLAVFGMYGHSSAAYPGIWSYGRKNKNRPQALNYEYRLAKGVNGSTISTIGAVVNFNGKLLVSWGTEDSHTSATTSEYGIDQVSSTTLASAVYEGLEFDAGQPFMKKFVDSVKVITSPLPSGTSYSVKFKTNKESDWRYAVLSTGSTTYSEADSIESEWNIGKPAIVYEVGAELNPSGSNTPEILSITSYLDNVRYEH